MTVTIAAVPALPHAAEIKALFLSHQRPEFPEFFDRTYPGAVAGGATSWIGRDADGQMVMHIACFPRRFGLGSRTVRAGLLVNLMVAERMRSFFPGLGLLRRLVQDIKARGEADFLYADPNDRAQALLRGTRFARLGTLRRYVLPISGRGAVRGWATRMLHTATWLVNGAPRAAEVSAHPAGTFNATPFAAPRAGARVTAHHDGALYRSRLPGYPGEQDWWLTARWGSGEPDTALLVRGPDAAGLAVLHVLRRGAGPLAAVVPGLIAELRRRKCERLEVNTIAESGLAGALRRCGFIPRREEAPVFALPFTPLGRECIRARAAWEVTDLECDR